MLWASDIQAASRHRQKAASMPTIRARALVALGLAASLGLAGCAATPDAEPAVEVQTGGSYTHAVEAAVTSIYAPTQIFHVALNVARQTVDSLVDQNPETGEIVPWLAESWTISDDAETYTFTLAEGNTFADGAPIDADAVKANFDFIAAVRADGKATGAGPLLNGYVDTQVIDDLTVEVTFDRPAAAFLQALAGAWFGLISPASLEYDGTPEGRTALLGVLATGDYAGSGPFEVSSFQGDSEIVLTARDDYDTSSSLAGHTGRAYVDELRFVVTTESSVRAGQVQTGEVQSASNIAFQDEATLESSGVTLIPAKIPGLTESLIFNWESPFAQDEAVRQAIAHAINPQQFIDTVFGASWGLPLSVLGSTTPGFADESDLLGYDLDEATELLEDAGWVDEDGDGIREKDGVRLSIKIPSAGAWAGAELLQAQLAEAGIDYQIQRLDAAASAAALAAPGNEGYDAHKWQMTRADPSILNAVWNSTRTSQGYARADSEELDELLLAQESAIDPAERAEASAAVQEWLISNAWVVPLLDRAWTYALNEEVGQGLELDSETKLKFYDVWVVQP
jgi:peptide/nickel transport system substrate-binding protein